MLAVIKIFQIKKIPNRDFILISISSTQIDVGPYRVVLYKKTGMLVYMLVCICLCNQIKL